MHRYKYGCQFSTNDLKLEIMLKENREQGGEDSIEKEFSLGESLGAGGEGSVRKCKWKGRELAVKCISLTEEKTRQKVMQEIKLVNELQHKNIVTFLHTIVKDREIFIIMPRFSTSL